MDDETRRAGAVVASVALIVATVCVYALSWTFALPAEKCAPDASTLICTAHGRRLATDIPTYGAVIATGLALVGTWVWPRRVGWLLVGYGGLLGATCAGVVIASTAT